jgi:hypothetical protein
MAIRVGRSAANRKTFSKFTAGVDFEDGSPSGSRIDQLRRGTIGRERAWRFDLALRNEHSIEFQR